MVGSVGKETKYVKWFYFFENTDEDKVKKGFDGIMKEQSKTYTYSVDKARTLWNEKTEDGFKRVTLTLHPYVVAYLTKGFFSIGLRWRLKYLLRMRIKSSTTNTFLEYSFFDAKGHKILF